MSGGLTWQPSLLGGGEPHVDPNLGGLTRVRLDERAWIDVLPGWLAGHDAVFDALADALPWRQPDVHLYDRVVTTPRLVANLLDAPEVAGRVPVLETMRGALSRHYGIEFVSVGFNLYRDGRDSVAWHGDRIPKEVVDPIVALVSVGAPRRFLVRPKGGGPSRRFDLGRGDLLVMGGSSQRTWEHSVPKVARAGPRLSIAFRHVHIRARY